MTDSPATFRQARTTRRVLETTTREQRGCATTGSSKFLYYRRPVEVYLRALLRRMRVDPSSLDVTVEDLTQDVLLELAEVVRAYDRAARREMRFRAYLQRAIRNRLLDHLRKRRPAPLDPDLLESEDDPDPEELGFELLAERGVQLLERYRDQEDLRHQAAAECLWERIVGDETLEELGAKHGRSVRTVRRWIRTSCARFEDWLARASHPEDVAQLRSWLDHLCVARDLPSGGGLHGFLRYLSRGRRRALRVLLGALPNRVS